MVRAVRRREQGRNRENIGFEIYIYIIHITIMPVYINIYIYIYSIYTSLSLPGHESGAGPAAGCQSLRRCSLQAVQDQAGAQGTRKLGDLQRKVSLKWRIPNSWMVYKCL